QPRRQQGGGSSAPPRARGARPGAGQGDRRGVRRRREGARRAPVRRRLEALHRARQERPEGPVRRHQRPLRVDQQDRVGGATMSTATGISRRRLLGLGVAGAAGAAAVGAFAGRTLPGGSPPAHTEAAGGAVPFYGRHQAGITTPAQDHLHFVAFDVITEKRGELVELLQEWTAAAARMTQGKSAGPFGPVGGDPQAPPDDTGEALDLPPSQLTLTIGFGPSLFDER